MAMRDEFSRLIPILGIKLYCWVGCGAVYVHGIAAVYDFYLLSMCKLAQMGNQTLL